MKYPESIVITKYPGGWSACLRFSNSIDDIIFSSDSREALFKQLVLYLYRKRRFYNAKV